MITTSIYQQMNPAVLKYAYSISLDVQQNTFAAFNTGTLVTNAMRAVYGYDNTANIKAVGFQLVQSTAAFAASSALDTLTCIKLIYVGSDLVSTGYTNSTGVILGIPKHDSVNLQQDLQTTPQEIMFRVVGNYTTTALSLSHYNAAGTAVSTTGRWFMNFLVYEYVSRQ